MDAGMLRLVFGLGTRAVDRTEGDYARIVALDNPVRRPLMHADDYKKFSQHRVDLLALRDNMHAARDADEVLAGDLRAPSSLFATADHQTAQRLRELGYTDRPMPYIVDFDGMLRRTAFPGLMRDMLALLARVYDYPVDIEFTVNFAPDGSFRISLVQCRPLQTRGLGRPVKLPELKDR